MYCDLTQDNSTTHTAKFTVAVLEVFGVLDFQI